MSTLRVFNFITLNGFFKGPGGDLSWHKQGTTPEEQEFSRKGIQAGSTLIFGRVTYEMMHAGWTSPETKKHMPDMAEGMTKAEKIVFSNTLKKADWNNTRVIGGDIVKEMKALKKSSEKDMTILGSGTIVTQFADEGLIDEYMLMVDPLALGEGTPIFQGLKKQLNLKLVNTQAFGSGTLVLTYHRA